MNRPWLIVFYLLLCCAIYVTIRLPNTLTWWLEFQSDHAIVGLMAKHMTEGSFPVYFYGQNYMGSLISLTSVFTSFLIKIFSTAETLGGYKLTVGPLAICFATLFWGCLALPVWFFAIKKKISVESAYLFLPILTISSSHLFKASALTNGSIAIFTLCGMLWWFTPNTSRWQEWEKFRFAAILGLGWWTNQNIVFFAVPILALLATEKEIFRSLPFRTFIQYRKLFIPFYAIAACVFMFGLFIALRGGAFEEHVWGQRVRIPSGTSTVRDSILIVIVLHLIAYIYQFAKNVQLRQATWSIIYPLRFGVIGFLVGYFPVWVGKILQWYPKNYGMKTNIMPIGHWGEHLWRTVSQTLPGSIASGSFLLFLFGLIFVVRAYIATKEKPYYREVRLLSYVLVFNLLVTLISERALGNNYRYLFASFFAFWILACIGVQSLRIRVFKPAFALGIAAVLFFRITPNIAQARAELEKGFTRKQKLANVLVNLREKGYQTCWGDFWTSYLVTYLSNENIVVSPHPTARDNQVRIPSDHKKVEAMQQNCYLYRKQSDSTADIYFSEVNPWIKN